MKQLFPFLIILVLFGCSNSDKTDKKSDSNGSRETSDMENFKVGKILFKVEPLKAKLFNKSKDTNVPYDTSEAINIQRDSSWVKRTGDTLKLITDKGETLIINNPSDNDDLATYEYLYFDNRINQYVISGNYWEAYGYVFVDKATGDKINSIGLPSVSPNGKYILTGNRDLVAGFTYNGIELYKKSSSIELIGSKELNSWGPLHLKWINDSTIYTKVSISDTTSSTLERTGYLKLTIKE